MTCPAARPPYTPFQKSAFPLIPSDTHDTPLYKPPTAANMAPALNIIPPVLVTAGQDWFRITAGASCEGFFMGRGENEGYLAWEDFREGAGAS
jgi:hypothetical protein